MYLLYKKISRIILMLAMIASLGLFVAKAHATDGSIDELFNSNGSGGQLAGFTAGVSNLASAASITCVEVDTNGKIMVGGSFSEYDGVAVGNVIRLNDNGTIDTSFNYSGGVPLVGFVGSVNGMTIQSDGKIVVTGNFTSYDGTSVPRVARLNTDGTLDTTFNTNVGTGLASNGRGVGIDYTTGSSYPGSITFGSQSATFNGVASKNLARVGSTGTPDATFNGNVGSSGAQNTVYQINYQSLSPNANKMIISGQFTGLEGHSQTKLARLNSDGSYDTTFNPGGTGPNLTVYSVDVLPNDKILIGGSFTTYNTASGTTTTGHIALLNSDGTLDTTDFNGGGYSSAGANGEIDGIYVEPVTGKIFIYGSNGFTQYNGITVDYAARLNANGTLDATFSSGTGINNVGVDSAGAARDYYLGNGTVFRKNGNIVLAGGFTSYNGVSAGNLVSLNNDIYNPVLSPITLTSSNANPLYAKNGDTITLSFTSNHPLTASTITLGGQSVTPSCVAGTGVSVNCTATITASTPSSPPSGAVTFSLDVTTVGGETVTSSATSGSVTVIYATPATPTVTVTSPTNNATPTISGTCIAGDLLSITVSSQTLTPTCSGGGTYSVTPTTLADGSYTAGTTQADIAGNVSAQATHSLVIDTTAPIITITAPTGSISSGATTISGACETGLTVNISGTGFSPSSGTASCTSSAYSFSVTASSTMNISVSQTDLAGNTGSASSTVIVSTPPAPTGGGNSGIVSGGHLYVCTDPTATNYDTYASSGNTSCRYAQSSISIATSSSAAQPSVSQTLGSGTCPSSLIISQNLEKGDRDGKTSPHNSQETVTQVNVLQRQINRILAASYNQAAGPVDGIFGTLTKQGVERLQTTLNKILAPSPLLGVDGIVGSFTQAAMNDSCGVPQS